MAKRSTTSRTRKSRSPQKRSEVTTENSSFSDFNTDAGNRDYKEIFMELISNPAVKYVAGGIATALLTRVANNMATRYPEISSFIKENLDNIEGKIGEFSRDLKGESARH